MIAARDRGFTLIELMVVLAVVAMVMMYVGPSMGTWIQNTQVRNAAESIAAGMQTARLEALKRNTPVAFRLNDPATTEWQVCVYDVVADLCSTAANAILAVHNASEGGANARVGADITQSDPTTPMAVGANVPGITVFDTFGRLLTTPNPNVQRVDARSAVLSVSDERRLVVFVSVGGQVRLCDPKLSKATNPQGCQ